MKEFDKIEKMLKDIETDEQISWETNDMEAKIEKIINRRIQKICLKTIGIVMAVMLCLFFVINPMLKAVYFNPVKMQGEKNGMLIPDYGDFTLYLRTYYETMFPYVELVYTTISDEDFGEYDVTLGIDNHLENRRFSSNINGTVLLNIKRNQTDYQTDRFGILSYMMGRFDNEWADKKTAMEQLDKLPDGTFVAVSLSAEEVRPITEVMKDPVTLEWVEVYTAGSDFQGGLNMNFHMRMQTDEKREAGEEGLCQAYKENLDMLLSEPMLLRALGVFSGNLIFMESLGVDAMKKTRDLVEEETQLRTRNYCISGTKEEVLQYLQKREFTSVMLDRA